jgi:hypothetical protein
LDNGNMPQEPPLSEAEQADVQEYIAGYQTAPVSAVTHYAPIDRIEPYGDGRKYKLTFSAPAVEIGPIPLGDSPQGAMQGPRYTFFDKLPLCQR